MARYRNTSYNRGNRGFQGYYDKQVKAQWMPQLERYKCHFPYNENFINLLKAKVPSGDRFYDPSDNHAWYISADYFDALWPIMQGVYAGATFTLIDKAKVEEYSQGMASAQVVSSDKLAEEFFTMLERAGLSTDKSVIEVIKLKPLYRKAAMYYHPDRRPERASDMSRLNELWSTLQSVYFK